MDTADDKRVTDLSRTARAEASAWIVKLHGPGRTPELEAALRTWLAASPENAYQFERVTEVWDAGAMPVPGVPRIARDQFKRDSRNLQPRRWLLATATVLVVVGAGSWSADTLWLNPGYITGIGEQRILRLPDGSRVTLSSDSSVTVSYRRHERRVALDHGEAFFEVAKLSLRPFRVRAGERQIEALGTSFDVRRESQQITVTLVDGKVAVSDLEQSTPQATLTKGQRIRLSSSHAAPRLDEPRIEAVTAWRRGEVMLDSTPLAEAVAEMNRYDQRALVIDDPSIATVTISGVYHTGDSELFADMVARLYGLGVEHRDGRIHLVTGNAQK
jgi:transmembrane sensor